jgi:hypothetical protein
MSDSPIRNVDPSTPVPEIEDAPEPELDPDSDHELAPIPDEPLFEPEEMDDFNPEAPWLHRPWLFKQMYILGKSKDQIAEENNVETKTIQLQIRLFDLK